MIDSFADEETKKVWNRNVSRKLSPDVQHVGLRKLQMIDGATSAKDLNTPGNHLEKLQGKRKGQMSIRINDQWRVCFCLENGHATDVSIDDYH